SGLDTFALNIPPDFQRNVLAGRSPAIQLNVDATRMSQAFNGCGYVQTIVDKEVQAFVKRYRADTSQSVDIEERVLFNPNLTKAWFNSLMKLLDMTTMLAIVITGAALLRERERGTVEHLLVMPVTPFEIMTSKVWSMGLVVLVASSLSLFTIVHELLSVPLRGSIALFLCGVAVHLFAVTSLGIFLATFTRSMPQFGLLVMLVLLPLMLLSGGVTAHDNMPHWVQQIMMVAPTTHIVGLAQAILIRGAGLEIVWPQFMALGLIGTFFFVVALTSFRKMIGTMA
ncbi:MAG TPA: ABC transporter permease, partial [Planctomycetaceae bacterium]|nr:ABC transporter permease [Planctomycetaceae bacterium]